MGNYLETHSADELRRRCTRSGGFELRKAKGLTEEAAAKLVADPMYYGMMMVKEGDADGLVSAVQATKP